ncbi:hypothetical protein [Mucilaginibacter sp. dw_454]|uniref:hypothetical protein n=1 Tax=Mucilaginibacter sp. dw_454 TaxID=2720079 RepID=UPI001BD4DC23|nr:hypothetical protein [Mucilaginibacter sp. dw_454]
MKVIAACFLLILLICITGCVQKQLAKHRQEDFCDYLTSHIKYPVSEREWQISGLATAVFVIDAHDSLKFLKIVEFPTNNMGREIFNKIKTAITVKKLGKGNWMLPIRFSMFIVDRGKTQISISSGQEAQAFIIRNHDWKNDFIYNPHDMPLPKDIKHLSEVEVNGYIVRAHEETVD